MSIVLNLEAIPNQEFSIRLEDLRYTIRLNSVAPDCMVATIYREDVLIIAGVRCVAGTVLLPYSYLEGTGGNFIFETPNDEIPDYAEFGARHQLLYLTVSELEELRDAL